VGSAGVLEGAGLENICVYSPGPAGEPPIDEDPCGADGAANAPVALCLVEGGANEGGYDGLYGSDAPPGVGRLGTPNICVNSPAPPLWGGVGGGADFPKGSFNAGCGRGAGDSTGTWKNFVNSPGPLLGGGGAMGGGGASPIGRGMGDSKIFVNSPGPEAGGGCTGEAPVLKMFEKSPGGGAACTGGTVPRFMIGVTMDGVADGVAAWNIWVNSPGGGTAAAETDWAGVTGVDWSC
jgi:hypothetical protein